MKKTDMTTGKTSVRRRAFLKGAAASTVVVGSGAVSAGTVVENESVKKAKPEKGYRESSHVREYYRLARF